ncbi:MAG: hypothetical protein HQ549_00170 [Candidatus Omnitrophica bacterium]|nr:hypothetical protein [Candidatus Omnitrophota bacterium]
MITKEKLLAALNELIDVEEGMVTLFANFSKAILKHAGEIEKDRKEEMTKMLSYLYRDSSKHKEMVDNMIEEVSKGTKNEY